MLERPVEVGLPADVDVGGIIVGGTRLTYRVIHIITGGTNEHSPLQCTPQHFLVAERS